MADSSRFREAMAHLGAAVSIVTTDGKAGRAGVTVSAVCSVTDSPATLLVCINRGSRSHAAFLENGVLCVNVLDAAHQELSGRFASRIDTDSRFDGARWRLLESGVPALEDAIAIFDCRITSTSEVGTHTVLLCAVQDVAIRPDGRGLIYFRRGYHPVGETRPSLAGAR
ncbi:flavin reductase [Gluconacetobacter tumulisoli]|uniref:Flavin reductase n=1 Tax=Gluconacetobacter tumulisoli TaxID=1286189 RepID=A0A7W4K855_9PROT|nr:flavin reductase [Gluconacetobacter tumulisoli]MBB2202116.1 flavin reductase [Gluconacetobacter tumulisoli]